MNFNDHINSNKFKNYLFARQFDYELDYTQHKKFNSIDSSILLESFDLDLFLESFEFGAGIDIVDEVKYAN